MLKPIRWNTFVRDFFVIQIGFALYGLSIALSLQANLGTNTWSIFEKALADITGLTVGTMSVIVAFFVLLIVLLFREKVGWGTLGNILSIGPWLDFFLYLIPPLENNLVLQSLMLLAAVLIQGIASAVYIGVNAGAGPRDSLMLAIHRTTKLSLRLARASIELTVFTIGWLLGGPAGIGTLIFAILIGPAVQWAFKIFNVKPHREELPESNVVVK
ncbi:MAG TPA: hypothetical protein DIW23_10080 [Anaerolineae bacterium]|nr:hypothetical protein [Anaerolineae bacterium]HRJ74913.1 hypothetical protein [Anaerolineales bacterium]